MLLNDPAGNRKTEASSSWISASGGIGAIKALEDMWEILWCDANASISNQDFGPRSLPQQTERHLSISGGILECVIQ
jgi:hypothetical protein